MAIHPSWRPLRGRSYWKSWLASEKKTLSRRMCRPPKVTLWSPCRLSWRGIGGFSGPRNCWFSSRFNVLGFASGCGPHRLSNAGLVDLFLIGRTSCTSSKNSPHGVDQRLIVVQDRLITKNCPPISLRQGRRARDCRRFRSLMNLQLSWGYAATISFAQPSQRYSSSRQTHT